jgi:hypothetical protein
VLEEKGGAGVSKAALSTRTTNPYAADFATLSCDRVPDSSSVTTCVLQPISDVHRSNATRERAATEIHGENDDDDGDFDRSEGDLRVTITEAPVFTWCESSPARPRPDTQVSRFIPLGKGLG